MTAWHTTRLTLRYIARQVPVEKHVYHVGLVTFLWTHIHTFLVHFGVLCIFGLRDTHDKAGLDEKTLPFLWFPTERLSFNAYVFEMRLCRWITFCAHTISSV